MKYFIRLLLILIIVGVIGFLFVKVIKIQSVTCKSQYGNCNSKLNSEIAVVKNKNIFEARKQLLDILKKDTQVMNYQIKFKLPIGFEVDIIQRKAIAAFVDRNGKFVLFDSEGNIVENANETNLPKITSYYSLNQTQISYIANLMKELYTLYGSNSGSVTADGFEVKNIKGKKVIFPLVGDRDIVLGSLALILSRLPSLSEATTISVIDLRFKNPVLK